MLQSSVQNPFMKYMKYWLVKNQRDMFRSWISVVKTIINHPPVITIFIGAMFTIPSHGW